MYSETSQFLLNACQQQTFVKNISKMSTSLKKESLVALKNLDEVYLQVKDVWLQKNLMKRFFILKHLIF